MLIYLIGYMGCGKTTLGKKLANKLNYAFIDLDQLIEANQQKSVGQIFTDLGEDPFRELERAELHNTFNLENTVIATGGGAPYFFDNMDRMNTNGTTVYIQMSAKSLFDRLTLAKAKRPLIKEKTDSELLTFIEENLSRREPFYKKSHHVIDGIGISPAIIIQKLSL